MFGVFFPLENFSYGDVINIGEELHILRAKPGILLYAQFSEDRDSHTYF